MTQTLCIFQNIYIWIQLQQHILQPKNINMKHLLIWAQKALFQRLAMAEASESIFFTFNFKLNCIWIKIWSKKSKKWNLIKSDQIWSKPTIWSDLIRFDQVSFFWIFEVQTCLKKTQNEICVQKWDSFEGVLQPQACGKGFLCFKIPNQYRCLSPPKKVCSAHMSWKQTNPYT